MRGSRVGDRRGRVVPWTLYALLAACSADGGGGPRSARESAASAASDDFDNASGTTSAPAVGRSAPRSVGGGALASTAGGAAGGDFAGNLRDDITFDWPRTPFTTASECPPGDYEGNFQGIYVSMLSKLAPGGPLPVPIVNLQLDALLTGGASGFRFTVEPAEGGETTQRVSGVMEGTADGAFPFVADIEGSLDCATGDFVADMKNGRYSVVADGLLPQTFEGIMTGRYDHRTRALVDGIWDVAETSAMPPGTLAPSHPRDFARDGYGGAGEWAAALPTDTTDPGVQPCDAPLVCAGGPLGPGKLLCGDALLGPPACIADADCERFFPGEGVTCLNASTLSLCLRECVP